MLTGTISSCGALERLSYDHVLPSFFLRRLKFTNAPYVSIVIFTITSLAILAVVDANITILSGIFTVAFLIMMGLFVVSNLLLKVNRDRLSRQPRVSLFILGLALVIVCSGIAGNVVMSPEIIGYFSVFFLIAVSLMTYNSYRGKLALALYWVYTRNTRLHSCRWTRNLHSKLIDNIKKTKKQPIIFFAKTDEVHSPHQLAHV